MRFAYKDKWTVTIRTAVGHAKLLVDTGATYTCINIKDLSKLLSVSIEQLDAALDESNCINGTAIDGRSVALYPFVLPRIEVGGDLFKSIRFMVSRSTTFTSVLGMDVIRHGNLNFEKTIRGGLFDFDQYAYMASVASKPTNKLNFLDYLD